MKSISASISKKKLLFFILTMAVFVGSFCVRWHNMSTIPYGIEEDEYAWVATARFVEKHIDPGARGIWSLHINNAKNFPFSLLVHQLAFSLFGPDILSARKILALYSTVSIVVFFFLARKFFRWFTALLVTAAYSFSTYHLVASKIALPSVYQELPMLLSFFLALQSTSFTGWKRYISILGAGVCIVVALLSYNITYMVPIITFGFLLYGCKQHRIPIKQLFVNIGIMCIPLLFVSLFLVQGIHHEFKAKQYIFTESNTKMTSSSVVIDIPNIAAHLNAALTIMWKPLTNTNSDMLMLFSAPLIPRFITVTAAIGLVCAVFQFASYWPILLWIMIQVGVYHILLGLNFPRTWILTVGSIYIVSGIAFETVCVSSIIKSKGKYFIGICYALCVIYLIYIGMNVYWTDAVRHYAYRAYVREAFDISKKYMGTKNAVFIVPESNPFWLANTWPTAVAFSLSWLKTIDSTTLDTRTRQDLGILSIDEFTAKIQNHLIPPCSTFIGEPARVRELLPYLSSECPDTYRIEAYSVFCVATTLPRQ